MDEQRRDDLLGTIDRELDLSQSSKLVATHGIVPGGAS